MASNTSRGIFRNLHHLPRRRCFRPRQCTRSVATYTSPQQSAQLSQLQAEVDTSSESYRDNAASMGELMRNLTALHEKAALGGPEKARQKHKERGKMLVRDRITALIDPGTSFMELSPLAGHEMYGDEEVPAGGILTGIGTVEGVMCMIVGNDSTCVAFSPSGLGNTV